MTVDERAAYPPLDVLKPVAENIWIVDSGPLRVLGMPLPVRATVIRLHDGDLLLHSPTRFDDGLRREMATLGRIRHLIAPNAVHWSFLKSWQQRCPDTLTWAAPGLGERSQVRKSGVRLDRELTDVAPADWAGEVMQVVVPGAAGFREVAFFHLASRTLVLTDLLQNLEPEKLPRLMRPLARLVGATAPDGRAPVYLRLLVKRGRHEAVEAAKRMVEWGPDRVIFSHGAWFQRDGTAELRRSLRWLLRGAGA